MKQVMVKCRYCGKPIKNTEAFDPHTRKTPLYYCNKEEYEREQQEKKDKVTVTCRICLKKIKKKDAFVIQHVSKSGQVIPWYYCSEEEYTEYAQKRDLQIKCQNKMVELMGLRVEDYKNKWSGLMSDITDLIDRYGFQNIYDYLIANEKEILYSMNKNFDTDYASRKYFVAIIRSGLKRYTPPKKETRPVFTEEVIEYKKPERRTGRVSLEDLEDDYE